MALLANGKIVVSGSCYDSASQLNQLCLARLHQDGSLDTAYGTNGIAKIAWGTQSIQMQGMALQTDDHVVVGATSGRAGVPHEVRSPA